MYGLINQWINLLTLFQEKSEKKNKTKKLTGDVDDVVVELVGEQRFRQLPEEGLEDHGCQVDVLHFSEVHALSYTRCREREKNKSLRQLKKTWIFEMAFARFFFFFLLYAVCRSQQRKQGTKRPQQLDRMMGVSGLCRFPLNSAQRK